MIPTDLPIREWIAELKKIPDAASLRRSDFFADHERAIHRYLKVTKTLLHDVQSVSQRTWSESSRQSSSLQF